jgi:serine/threonine-protein kinase ULK/ATG1
MYMSPQVLSHNYYTYKCDVWSLGIIFYEMLFGQLPWKTIDTNQLLFKIMETPYPYADLARQISETSRLILDATLKYLEKERLGWTDLLALRKKRKKIFGEELRSHEPLLRTLSEPVQKVSLL